MATLEGETCAVLATGARSCRGGSSNGVFEAASVASNTPVTVAGVSGASQVALGRSHACVVESDGTVLCWGTNTSGGLANVKQIVVGGDASADGAFSCARKTDGTVACWGSNLKGALGIGVATGATTPTAVPGLANVTHLAAGANHVCALLGDKTVRCWGANDAGQLGLGTKIDAATPTAVPSVADVRSITTGFAHTCVALTDGTGRCWGSNELGQLGTGKLTYVTKPTVIPGLSIP